METYKTLIEIGVILMIISISGLGIISFRLSKENEELKRNIKDNKKVITGEAKGFKAIEKLTVSNTFAPGHGEPGKSSPGTKCIGLGYSKDDYKKVEHKSDIFIMDLIEKCKKEGKTGCILTIDNQQVYVSFYK